MGPLEILKSQVLQCALLLWKLLLSKQIMKKWMTLSALLPESEMDKQSGTFLSLPVATKKNMDPCCRTHFHERGHFLFSFLEHEVSEIYDPRCLSLPWYNLFS